MATPDMVESSPERHHPRAEGIFPLHELSVQTEYQDLFRMTNQAVLDIIRDARIHGPEDDLFVFLAKQGLERWHVEEGDFSEADVEQVRPFYQIGLLYGVDMAQRISQYQRVSGELKADNPIALLQALSFLKNSYRGLNSDKYKRPDRDSGAPELVPWMRQKERELKYTGSDILTVANATLQDVVTPMMQEAGVSGYDAQAIHVGLVDGVLAFNAYERYLAGSQPRMFSDYIEYIPVFDRRLHTADENPISLIGEFQFEPTDKLSDLVNQAKRLDAAEMKLSGTSLIAHGHNRLVQVGPNIMMRAMEIEMIERPRLLSARRLGAYLASSLVVCAAVDTLSDKKDLDIAQSGLLAMIATGVLAANRYRKDRSERRRYGDSYRGIRILSSRQVNRLVSSQQLSTTSV